MEKRTYDFCFHTGQGMDAVMWFLDIKEEFGKRGLSVIAYSLNPKMGEAWEALGMKDYVILPKYTGKIDVDWAAKLTKTLGISNFRSLYQTEKVFWDFSEQYCLEKTASLVHSVYMLKDTFKARIYGTYGGDEFDHNSLRLLCRLHGGRILYTQPTNLEDRLAIIENEDRVWQLSTDVIPEPTDEQIAVYADYVRTYTSAKKVLWATPQERDIKWDWTYPFRFIKRAARSRSIGIDRPQGTNSQMLRQYLSRAVRRFRAKGFYHDPSPFVTGKISYIYFPLHYPKDSQLTLRAKPFINQAAVVEMVSQFVPYPHILLVKEHPHARGFYKTTDLKAMSALPNVRLIHPFTNSHDLIPKAKAIVAINSSVGYEGIMYKKPVITLGKSFYRGQGLTIDVNSLYDLEAAFTDIDKHQVSEDRVLHFIHRMHCESYYTGKYHTKTPQSAADIVAVLCQYFKIYA
jgi:septum formation topological specificity factor MinE